MALSNQVTAVQAILANTPFPTLVNYLQMISIIEGIVVNTAGVITIGGIALTNYQYFQLGEIIGVVW